MSSFVIRVDATSFTKSLSRFKGGIPPTVEKSLFQIGGELLRMSKTEVPHDTGFLQSTGVEQTDRGIFGNVYGVEVGYHTAYAARLHENPQFRFQKGRKGKYLEDPLKANTPKFLLKLGEDIKKELERK